MSEPCRLRQDEGYGACDDEGKVLGVSPSSGYELMSSLQSSLHSTRQICQVSIPLPCSSSNGKTPSIRPPSCWRPPACSTPLQELRGGYKQQKSFEVGEASEMITF